MTNMSEIDYLQRLASVELSQGTPADLEHWSKVPSWTIEEGTALSFGIEPGWVESQNVKEWAYPCGEDYKKRLILGRRAHQAGSQLIAPRAYIAWAKTVDIPFPAELECMVHMVVKPAKPLGNTERNKYDLLNYALLKTAFPDTKPRDLAGKMKHACELNGIHIDEDTLRNRRDSAFRAFEDSRS